jgi:hypothetical protein
VGSAKCAPWPREGEAEAACCVRAGPQGRGERTTQAACGVGSAAAASAASPVPAVNGGRSAPASETGASFGPPHHTPHPTPHPTPHTTPPWRTCAARNTAPVGGRDCLLLHRPHLWWRSPPPPRPHARSRFLSHLHPLPSRFLAFFASLRSIHVLLHALSPAATSTSLRTLSLSRSFLLPLYRPTSIALVPLADDRSSSSSCPPPPLSLSVGISCEGAHCRPPHA